MKFRDWYNLVEMGGIRDMDTSGVDLRPIAARFDNYTAGNRCEAKAKDQDFYKGIYDNYADDLDFMKELDAWKDAHPQPDYYSNTEEYRAWENEYYKLTNAWEAANSKKRREIQPQFDAFMQRCVEEVEREHREKTPNKGYKYNFNIEGKNYIATFYRVSEEDQRKDGSFSKIIPYIGTIPGTFNIEFEGPDGYSLTKREGGGATKVYTQLLLGAKKLLDSEKVNALYFSPADSAMALMYKKFYDQFLANDFIQPGKNIYIRKSYLKEKLKSLPDERKQAIYNMILRGNRDIRSNLKNIQQQKITNRNIIMNAKQQIGKIVGYKYSASNIVPIYVLGASSSDYEGPKVQAWAHDSGSVLKINWNLTPDNPNELSRITDASSINPEILEGFKKALKQKVGI